MLFFDWYPLERCLACFQEFTFKMKLTACLVAGGLVAAIVLPGLASRISPAYSTEITSPHAKRAGARGVSGGVSGPGVDDILALATDPVDANVVFVGTDNAGIWKSTDAGATWVSSNSGIGLDTASELAVFSLIIDPSAPEAVYAGSGGGVYKSMDGGATWVLVKASRAASVDALAINPSEPGTVYAGTFGKGIFKTADGGGHWSAVNSGLADTAINALAIDPADPLTVYAGSEDAGLFKSVNGGARWAPTSFPQPGVDCVTIEPSSPSRIYAAGSGFLTPDGIYTSTDGGATWARSAAGLSDIILVDALAIDPSNPGTVYAGDEGTGVYKTSDSGQSWTAFHSGLANPRVEAVAVSQSGATTLYAGTTDGAFKSTDAGLDWAAVGGGLPPAAVDSLAIDPTNASIIYAGTNQGMIYSSSDGGSTWGAGDLHGEVQALGGIQISDVHAIAVDPAHPATVYIGTDQGPAKSTDGGATWSLANASPASPGGIIDFAFSFDMLPSGALLTGDIEGVFESTDGGATWVPHSTGFRSFGPPGQPASYFVFSLATDPTNPNTIYAGTGTQIGVYKSMDGGASWSKMSSGLPRTANLNVNALGVNPSNPQTIYAGSDKGLFQSTNGGVDWFRLDLALSDMTVSALAIDPRRPNALYAGTDDGVLRSVDGGKNWTVVSLPLINSIIDGLALDPSDSSTVYVASKAGLFRFTSTQPVISSATFDGRKHLTISGSALSDVTQVLINGADVTRPFSALGESTIVLRGKESALGLKPGSNTIEVVNPFGSSNMFILAL